MRDFDKPGPSVQGEPLSSQLIARHLQHCRDLTKGYAYRAFPAFWHQWCLLIEGYSARAGSNKEQSTLHEIHRLMLSSQQNIGVDFGQRLGGDPLVQKGKASGIPAGQQRASGAKLSLVEHADLEETIAINSITHRADSLYGEQLWALNQRLALLNKGVKPDERTNPASPFSFCEALREALVPLKLDIKTKLIGYKVFEREVIGQLDELYEEINRYLINQNLLPHLSYVAAAGGSSQTATDDGDSSSTESGGESPEAPGEAGPTGTDRLLTGDVNSADSKYQNDLLNAIFLLQSHISLRSQVPQAGAELASSAPESDPRVSDPAADYEVMAYSQDQLVTALQNLQVQALGISRQMSGGTASPPEVSRAQPFSQQVLVELTGKIDDGAAIQAQDLHLIDLVGMLFEYMLSDDNLPDSIKALLSYLHTPFLKIAFIDKDFFSQAEHPARVLLNSLAEAGARWVGNDGSSQYDMYTKIKEVVFRLLEEFKNDVRIFAELLLEFKTYTRSLVRRQELMERRALEKVQGEDKLHEAKRRVNQEVRGRTDGCELPSAVLLLLLQPWSDYLSFVLLRYGETSDSWHRALQVMDELLWSLEPKTLQEDKDKQLDLQELLLRSLQGGFDIIGYDASKGRKLLEAIRSLQRMALQCRRAEPAPEPMRAKLESMAAEKAGQIQLDTQSISAEEAQLVGSLKMIEFGTWFEFEGGKRLKVAWYNKRSLHYMLVDQQGRKVAMRSGLELAREMLAGKARIISGSTKPFFERALENIYQNLNAKAQANREQEETP